MKTFRIPALVLSMSLAFGLTACSGSVDTLAASNLGNEQLQASSSVFTLNGTTTPDALAEGGRGGRSGPGGPGGKGSMGKGGPGGDVLMGLFHSSQLTLSDEQQAALQTLQSEFQSAQPKPEAPDEATRTAQQEAFKQAFLSDTLTVDTLKALQPTRPEPDTAALAAHLVAVSQIFTAEQKATIAAEVAEREANRPAVGDRPERPDHPAADSSRPDPLVAALGLSDTQATQLAALREANRPAAPSDTDRTAKESQHQALVAELLKDNPSVATVQTLLAATRPGGAKDNAHLAELVQIHDLLTAEQRQAFVELKAQGPVGGKGGGMGRPPLGRDLGNFGGPGPRLETAIL